MPGWLFDEMNDPEFWGIDADGRKASSGERLVYAYEEFDGAVSTERIKIGYTATGQPLERIAQQKTGNSRSFRYLGSWVVRTKADEATLHKLLSPHRIHGGGDEWFWKTPEVMRVIDRSLHPRIKVPLSIAELMRTTGESVTLFFGCPKCEHPNWLGWKIAPVREYFSVNATLEFIVRCPKCSAQLPIEVVSTERNAA